MMASLPFNYKVYEKKNKLYVVINYKSEDGKYKKKWIATGLNVGTKKKEVTAVTEQIVAEYYNSFVLENQCDVKLKTELPVNVKPETEYLNEEIDFIGFMDKWLDFKKQRVAKLTYQCYCSGIKDAKAFFGKRNAKLQDIRPIDIQDYYNNIISRGAKVSTMKNRHLCLHNMFEYAVKLDLIPFNPTSRVDLPKSERREATFYNKSELETLFKAFKDDRMELVVHIAAYYGLRRSEILGLQWDSVDFEQKTITISRKVITYMDEMGKCKTICEDKLKTNSTRRTLPLIPHIEKLLINQKDKRDYYRKLLRDGYCKDYLDFVCTDDFGILITPEYVTSHFGYVVKKNELKHLRFHDLRHTCASLLIANHIPLKSIQDWLGHANFQTTANIYSHLDFSSRIESADMITSILGDSETGIETSTEISRNVKRGRKPKSTVYFLDEQ